MTTYPKLGTPSDYLIDEIDKIQARLARAARSATALSLSATSMDLDCVWLDLIRIQSALAAGDGRKRVVTLSAKTWEEHLPA